MYLLYSSLLAIGFLISIPYWAFQMLRHGKYGSGLGERLGRVASRLTVQQLGLAILLHLAKASGAAVAVVNARIYDRSWRGYHRFRFLLRQFLQNIDLFLAQTNEDARRLQDIGAPAQRIQVSGNLKFDFALASPPPIVASLRSAFLQSSAHPIIVCGSTVEDEEPLLLRAFENVLASYPKAAMILAPRHPERFEKIAELLQHLGIRFWRRSLWNGDPVYGGVFLLDTIGELASTYALADVAFVGGSLVP